MRDPIRFFFNLGVSYFSRSCTEDRAGVTEVEICVTY